MLNASFCGVNEITGGQAVKLQDRNLVLHGNPMKSITWPYENELKKIPAWLRTLEKVTYADLAYCDVKEMQGGVFPTSLEELWINNQGSDGLRLHPDSFEGLPNLHKLEISTNKITEDDMHPGLFAGATSLGSIELYGNTEMRRFNATELFPGGSKTVWVIVLDQCGLEEGTGFQGLPHLKWLDLEDSVVLPPRLFSGLCALRPDRLNLGNVTEWSDDTFAGTTLCDAIWHNDAAKQACWEQADADSESVCGCQLGTCSSCESEDSCGSHSWCAWEADDGALGGSCSDPLIAPGYMDFFECAHFCSYEVEGGRIPCVASMEDNN
jgi:hypothetical protein